jgi:signal transduction histidine kinase
VDRLSRLPRLPWLRLGQPSADPSAAMFERIRWNLTALYTSMLAVTLLIIGVVLYQGERNRLLGPVDDQLRQDMRSFLGVTPDQGFPFAAASSCPGGFGLFRQHQYLWACYDQKGQLLDSAQDAPRRFLDASIADSALQNGSAIDTVDTHSGILRRYAVRVVDPQSGFPPEVLVIGAGIGDRITALDTLLTLLLICGGLGLVASAASGFWLANRSLRPVRLAYGRQRDFIADASHELRTPLTLVRADVEVLLRDRQHLNPDQISILQDVVAEVAHMGSLATNMLDLAQLDAGRLRIERDVVDLAAMARDVARRALPLAVEHGVSVRMEDGAPLLVIGDPLLLEHIVLILVDNAIKYNRPGGEVVLSTLGQGDRALLEVRDTGIGIAPEHLPHLGERFYRVDKARSRESGGAGLGVSIAQAIAAEHGGALSLASRLNEGTTATLSLPAASKRSAIEERPRLLADDLPRA